MTMKCQDVVHLLDEYLDSSLSAEISREIADHVAGCPACGRRLKVERELMNRINRSLRQPHPGDHALWKKALASVPATGTSRVASRRAPYFVSFGFAAAGVVVLMLLLNQSRKSELSGPASADYGECLNAVMPLTVESDRFEDINRYFESRLGCHIEPCAPLNSDVQLIGGRPCVFRNAASALLVFHVNGKPVSVFVVSRDQVSEFPEPGATLSDSSFVSTTGSLEMRCRAVGHQIVCGVGECDPAHLDQLVAGLCVGEVRG